MASKRQHAEQEQRRSAIERHVGRTAEQRLRWAVEVFLRADLKTEIPETLAAYGAYLKAFAPQPSRPGELVTASLGPTEGLSVDQVTRIHRRFGDGLTALRRRGEWPDVPLPSSRTPTAHGSRASWVVDYNNPEAAIVAGLAEHAVMEWSRLRDCPKCHRLFVRNRKQQYCSAPCSMAVRNRNRKTKKKTKKGT
jgi:hypothetical protein